MDKFYHIELNERLLQGNIVKTLRFRIEHRCAAKEKPKIQCLMHTL